MEGTFQGQRSTRNTRSQPSHHSVTIINHNGTINLGDVGRVDLHEVVQVLYGHLGVDCHPVHLGVQAVQ